MSRNYTRELRRAKDQGAKIVCSMAPYDGIEVTYVPRTKGDPTPWSMTLPTKNPDNPTVTYYYSGRECHPVGPNGGPWALASLLRI